MWRGGWWTRLLPDLDRPNRQTRAVRQPDLNLIFAYDYNLFRRSECAILREEQLGAIPRRADAAAAARDAVGEQDAAAVAAQHEMAAADAIVTVRAVVLQDRVTRPWHDRAGLVLRIQILDLAAVLAADDDRGIGRELQLNFAVVLG